MKYDCCEKDRKKIHFKLSETFVIECYRISTIYLDKVINNIILFSNNVVNRYPARTFDPNHD